MLHARATEEIDDNDPTDPHMEFTNKQTNQKQTTKENEKNKNAKLAKKIAHE